MLFTATGAFAEEVAPPACRLVDNCGPEPIRTLSFGLLVAVIGAAFLYPRAVPVLAAAFLVLFAVAHFVEVGEPWWVAAAAAGFAALASYLTLPRHATVPGLSERTITARRLVTVDSNQPLVRPWWLLGCAVAVVLAAVGIVGYVLGRPDQGAADWLLGTGLAGGLAFTMGWRAVDRSITRRWFLRRAQPGRECSVLPLRFEMIVVPDHGDTVLVIPSSVWEEARLERLWASASRHGCRATLYGEPMSGRWHAVEVDGQVIVGREPSWVEEREASLREAVNLIRHLADAIPRTDVADVLRHSADSYAAQVGEPDSTMPGG